MMSSTLPLKKPMAAPQNRAMTWYLVTIHAGGGKRMAGRVWEGTGGADLNAALEHVREGQVADMHVCRFQFYTSKPRAGSIGDDVAVAEHGALRVARGAAGEANGCEHVRARAVELVGGELSLTGRLNLLK